MFPNDQNTKLTHECKIKVLNINKMYKLNMIVYIFNNQLNNRMKHLHSNIDTDSMVYTFPPTNALLCNTNLTLF